MALVLGEEKRAKPKPSTIKRNMMDSWLEFSWRKTSRKSPMVVSVMPTDDTIRGSILSESLPANGETIAMTTGAAIKMSPAL